MPDVANALKFQKKMVKIESEYLRQIDSYRAESRRALLEIVERGGVSRPAVALMVREVDHLSRQVSNLAGAAANETKRTVYNFTRKQIATVEKLNIVKDVNLTPVLNAGDSAFKDAESSYMTNESSWLSQLQTSLQVQAAKLRLSSATPEEITARLLSERFADGRASVWRAAGASMQTQETNNLWSLAGSVAAVMLFAVNETTPAETQFSRQWISTVDERTTEVCLHVHGAIAGMEENFVLAPYSPRFSDEVYTVPGHWNCRSAVTLYEPSMEEIGITTEQMREAAQAEIKAQAESGKVEIYPSYSTARRP